MSINLETNSSNFQTRFLPNVGTINNEIVFIKAYESTMCEDELYTSDNIADLINKLKVEFCRVKFSYNVNIRFKQDEILVYKINRNTRKERTESINLH